MPVADEDSKEGSGFADPFLRDFLVFCFSATA